MIKLLLSVHTGMRACAAQSSTANLYTHTRAVLVLSMIQSNAARNIHAIFAFLIERVSINTTTIESFACVHTNFTTTKLLMLIGRPANCTALSNFPSSSTSLVKRGLALPSKVWDLIRLVFLDKNPE